MRAMRGSPKAHGTRKRAEASGTDSRRGRRDSRRVSGGWSPELHKIAKGFKTPMWSAWWRRHEPIVAPVCTPKQFAPAYQPARSGTRT